MMVSGDSRIAIAISDSLYNESVGSIHVDPLYNPTRYIKTQAEVVGLPFKTHPDYTGFIARMRKFSEEGRKINLYFDYKAIDETMHVKLPDGRKMYFVPVELTYAFAIEDQYAFALEDTYLFDDNETKEVYPNTGIVLCRPWFGFGFETIEVAGVKMVARTNQLIVTDINPPEDERVAEVAYVGDVYDDYFLQDIKPGDLVFREAHTNYDYEIAGEKLFIVRLENIDGVLTGEDFEYFVEDSDKSDKFTGTDATGAMKTALEVNEVLKREKKSFRLS